jgi:hypothetical protein
MKLTTRETVLITIIFAATALAPSARAAHAAPHLDPLHLSVSNRIADTNEARSVRQRNALRSADRTLKRNTRTFAGDVSLLATASRTLNARFTNDFVALEEDALVLYAAEGEGQLDLAWARIGTNAISRSASNRLARARDRLDSAEANTNSIPRQARALSSALRLVRSATAPIFRKFTNSVPTGPTAPLSLAGKDLDLVEATNVNDQVIYFLDPYVEGGTGNYDGHNPHGSEDVGQWSYTRVNDTTGTILLNPDFPPGAANHTFTLTFLTATNGTFTGTTVEGNPLSGTFRVFTIGGRSGRVGRPPVSAEEAAQ